MALAMVMMQKAMKGNVKAFEQIARLVAIDTKDSLDRKEQRERIAAIQLENERRKEQLDSNGVEGTNINIINAWEDIPNDND